MQNHHHDETAIDEEVGRTGTNMLSVSSAVSNGLIRVPPVTKDFGTGAGSLGQQLAVVSQLIAAGLPTRAYGVQLEASIHTLERKLLMRRSTNSSMQRSADFSPR